MSTFVYIYLFSPVSKGMLLFCSGCGACGAWASGENDQQGDNRLAHAGQPSTHLCIVWSAMWPQSASAVHPTPCSLLMRSYSAEGEQLQCVANSSNAILQPLGASSQCNAFLPSLIMQWHGGLRCSGNVSSYKKKYKKKTRMLGLWVRSCKLHCISAKSDQKCTSSRFWMQFWMM